MSHIACSCSCGTTRFHVPAMPMFRALCHCTICQRFNDAAFADVLVFRADDVELPPAETVQFDTYKPPPNVRRGKCVSCEQPAIETFAMPVLPRLVMVPRGMFDSDVELPSPVAHMFYDKRVSDADDPYPKHGGFLRSQFAFLKYLWAASRSET